MSGKRDTATLLQKNSIVYFQRHINLLREEKTDTRNPLITEYDWPASYIYIPWPIDKLTRDAISKEQIAEIEKSRVEAQRMKGR